ncbi:PAS domain-containing protein [Methylophaga thalassica]
MPDCTIHKLRHINNNINIILINENYEVISSPFDLPCLAKEQCPLKPTSLDNLFNAISDSRKESDKNDLIHITSSAFFHSSVAMTITSHDNKIIAVNTAFTQITGFKQHEILGKNPRILSSGKHDKQFYGEMWTALSREKKWSGEIWNKPKMVNYFSNG